RRGVAEMDGPAQSRRAIGLGGIHIGSLAKQRRDRLRVTPFHGVYQAQVARAQTRCRDREDQDCGSHRIFLQARLSLPVLSPRLSTGTPALSSKLTSRLFMGVSFG